jgi:hypothetical protein
MSTQRTPRVRAPPARLEDEQAEEQDIATILTSLRRFQLQTQPVDISSDDEEEESEEDIKDNEVEEEKQTYNINWTKDHTSIRSAAFIPVDPPVVIPDAVQTPLDFFRLFITVAFTEYVVQYTNQYAGKQREEKEYDQKNIDPNIDSDDSADTWSDVCVEEINALFGCLIYMGIVPIRHKYNKKRYYEMDFRQELMSMLVGKFSARHKPQSYQNNKRMLDCRMHLLQKRNKLGDCVLCRPTELHRGQHGKRTNYVCEQCDVYLCYYPCFTRHVSQHTAQ